MTRPQAKALAKQAANERYGRKEPELLAIHRDLDTGRYAWVIDAVEAAYARGVEVSRFQRDCLEVL